MNIFPAIDLYGGQAVRLYKGDYDAMTVYDSNPLRVALAFKEQGARFIHLVDLEGAKDGTTPHLSLIEQLVKSSDLTAEVGGGIRSMEVVERYIKTGVSRVILGTAAVSDEKFLRKAVETYGEKIAVGVDLSGGKVAVRGWKETTEQDGRTFCRKMQDIGVSTIICTDIARDGAMRGANHALYQTLSRELSVRLIASGGVSTLDDVRSLRALGLYGAIIGKAYYTGAISLAEAIEVAK